MRAARLECCLAPDMLVPPSFDNTSDATSASPRGRRSQVGSELVPADDSASYSGRRPSPGTGCLKRTGNVKSCEPERPQDLTNRECAEPAFHQREARPARRPGGVASNAPGARLPRLSRGWREAVTDPPTPSGIGCDQG